MAQLSDDCFAFGGPLLSVDDAMSLIEARIPAVAGIETVTLDAADNRVLAKDLVSRVALPPFDNSAVDGWAVRHGDLAMAGESILPVGGRIAAGASAKDVASAGVAVRIFTGAPMPAGADTVFMQEDVSLRDGAVVLPLGLKRGANRRLAGEDVASGDVVLAAGRRLRPQDVALAAAVGENRLNVRRRLRVALFSTGDELREPGEALADGAIHDSNRVMLAALLRRLGVVVDDLGILPDDPARLSACLATAARGHDLIVTSGGVSTGEEDHVKAAVERAGSLVFWRLGIKPGRPVAMGIIDGTPFVGLPGNPVAVYVTFCFLVSPLVARLAGAAVDRPLGLPVRAGFRYSKKRGRREYVRVSLQRAAGGAIEAAKHPREGAGIITSLTQTDGLAELPETVSSVAVGDTIAFYPYALLW
jgi:molybdopterin molybdotransferase